MVEFELEPDAISLAGLLISWKMSLIHAPAGVSALLAGVPDSMVGDEGCGENNRASVTVIDSIFVRLSVELSVVLQELMSWRNLFGDGHVRKPSRKHIEAHFILHRFGLRGEKAIVEYNADGSRERLSLLAVLPPLSRPTLMTMQWDTPLSVAR